jgi:hypothetical protein
VAAGVIAAPLLGVLASPSVRVGLARVADPSTGRWFDGRVLALGTLALAVLLLGTGVAIAWRLVAVTRQRAVPLRSRRLLRLTGWSPAAMVGATAAGGGGQPSARRLIRSTVAGVAFAMAGLLAVQLWSASITHLGRTYRLQGWDFNASGEQTVVADPGVIDRTDQQLRRSPSVQRLARYDRAQIPIGGNDVDVFGLTQERGLVHPTMRRGRPPAGPGEVVLGPGTMVRLRTRIGGRIEVNGQSGPVGMTVVGEATFPLIGNGSWGEAMSMTTSTLQQLGAPPLASGFLLQLAPGADLAALQATVGKAVALTRPFSPPIVNHIRNVRGIVVALAWFFAALGAVVFAYGVLASTRRQARDYAVLRTIGFRGRQVVAAAGWQVAIIAGTSIVLAGVLGVALGRAVWNATAHGLGVLDAFSVPLGPIALTTLVAVAVSAAVALLAAWRPVRSTIAASLRWE